MNREISYGDKNRFLYLAVNMFISAEKMVILWPQGAIQGTTVFGTSASAFFSPRGCCSIHMYLLDAYRMLRMFWSNYCHDSSTTALQS